MLVNVVQQFTDTKIHTVELIEEEQEQTIAVADVDPEKRLWTDENTKMLIDLYEKYDDEFQSGVKKYTWNKIANIFTEEIGILITGVQCDTKWKGLLRNYKLVKKHNETSGNEPKHWKFYSAMDRILHKKPEISPVATCSSACGLQITDGINTLNYYIMCSN